MVIGDMDMDEGVSGGKRGQEPELLRLWNKINQRVTEGLEQREQRKGTQSVRRASKGGK